MGTNLFETNKIIQAAKLYNTILKLLYNRDLGSNCDWFKLNKHIAFDLEHIKWWQYHAAAHTYEIVWLQKEEKVKGNKKWDDFVVVFFFINRKTRFCGCLVDKKNKRKKTKKKVKKEGENIVLKLCKYPK